MTRMQLQPLRSAFLALPLDDEATVAFRDTQCLLDCAEASVSLQSPETPHLTLVFWKELLPIECEPVQAQAKKIAAGSSPFSLAVTGADTFGSRGDDRVLYLSVSFSPELAAIKKRCPWPQLQPFHPHITLARIRHPQRFRVIKKEVMKRLKRVSFSISIDRLRFYAEVQGKKQTAIAEWMLGGP